LSAVTYDEAFSFRTLALCLPKAVRVFFGKWAIVRLLLAAAAAFLIFFRAADVCFSLAISSPEDQMNDFCRPAATDAE